MNHYSNVHGLCLYITLSTLILGTSDLVSVILETSSRTIGLIMKISEAIMNTIDINPPKVVG